jgi:hypothetical protein
MSRARIWSTHGEREPPARQGPHHERGELLHVVGEVVGEEPSDVRERRASLLDGGHDGGEVVVEEHQVGGLARHVGARAAHGHPDRRLAQRRRVVDAVAGHRHHVAPLAQRPGDAQLVLRGDPGHHGPVPVQERPEHAVVAGQALAHHNELVRAVVT